MLWKSIKSDKNVLFSLKPNIGLAIFLLGAKQNLLTEKLENGYIHDLKKLNALRYDEKIKVPI